MTPKPDGPPVPLCGDSESLSFPKDVHSASGLNILHLNAQSIREIISDLEVLFYEGSYDIIGINEHWLKSEELNLVNIEGYRVVSSFCRSEMAHGGVCILVREALKCCPFNVSFCTTESHFEAAGAFLADCNTYIFSIYRTPSSSYNESVSRLSLLLDKLKVGKFRIIIAGDFNVHFDTDFKSGDRDANDLCNLMESYGLRQMVYFNTRNNACLDNIFTNIGDSLCTVGSVDASHLSDHSGVSFCFQLPCADRDQALNGKTRVNFRPITDFGLFQFYNTIERADWGFVSDPTLDIESRFNVFF